MQSVLTRCVLTILALAGVLVGGWADFVPRSFYTDFPGIRPGYVSMDGPFNEHLIRDVGSMFLAMAAIAIGALVVRSLAAARIAGAAWLVFSVSHLAYHITHLGMFQTLDKVLIVLGLSALVLLPLLVVVRPGRARTGASVT